MKGTYNKLSIRSIICFGILILMMLFITMLSNQTGQVSVALSEKVASGLHIEYVAGFRHLSTRPLFLGLSLRACAHVLLYAVLGFAVFKTIGYISGLKNHRELFTVIICFGFSLFDEFHQMFVPGRDFEIADLVLDAFGYTVIIIVAWTLQLIRKRISVK